MRSSHLNVVGFDYFNKDELDNSQLNDIFLNLVHQDIYAINLDKKTASARTIKNFPYTISFYTDDKLRKIGQQCKNELINFFDTTSSLTSDEKYYLLKRVTDDIGDTYNSETVQHPLSKVLLTSLGLCIPVNENSNAIVKVKALLEKYKWLAKEEFEQPLSPVTVKAMLFSAHTAKKPTTTSETGKKTGLSPS